MWVQLFIYTEETCSGNKFELNTYQYCNEFTNIRKILFFEKISYK